MANMADANLRNANFERASLIRADLSKANLTKAKLRRANLYEAEMEETELEEANLEIAQFVYLLLNNPKIRDIIDTIGKKAVLILGRFTPDRKSILKGMRDELRKFNFVPILFDFEKPSTRDLTETISTLAHMAHFLIVDLTDAKGVPQELQRIIPGLPSLPT